MTSDTGVSSRIWRDLEGKGEVYIRLKDQRISC